MAWRFLGGPEKEEERRERKIKHYMEYYNVSRKRAIELVDYKYSTDKPLPIEIQRKQAEIYKR